MIKSRPNFALIAPGIGVGVGGFYRTARQSCDNVWCGSFREIRLLFSVNKWCFVTYKQVMRQSSMASHETFTRLS